MNIKQYAKKIYGMSQLELFSECMDMFEQVHEKWSHDQSPQELIDSLTIDADCNDDGTLKEVMRPQDIKLKLCNFPNLVAVLHQDIKELGLFNVVLVTQESPTTLTYYNAKLWVVPQS